MKSLGVDSYEYLQKNADKNALEKLKRPVIFTEYKPLENVDYSFEYYDPSFISDITLINPVVLSERNFQEFMLYEKHEDNVITSLNYSNIKSMEPVDPLIKRERNKFIVGKHLLKFLYYDIVYTISKYIK